VYEELLFRLAPPQTCALAHGHNVVPYGRNAIFINGNCFTFIRLRIGTCDRLNWAGCRHKTYQDQWLGRDPREFLGMETNEGAKKPRAVVHSKKKKTVQVETAKALGELILAVQKPPQYSLLDGLGKLC
jgi:hypothetical protein